MPNLIDLETFSDNRGDLTVIEKVIPFNIKRIYYIYNSGGSIRGGHRHKITSQAAICMRGSCSIYSKDGDHKEAIKTILDNPAKCLIINPEDYHWMEDFSDDCILLVLASENFDSEDYIYEKYED
jgi:dTDP-4-dehydrorhamnose 3,5-epimerase-like enzyme